MNRLAFEHLIRAAGDILGESTVIVVGSQAILASLPEYDLPSAATRSLEVDILPIDDPDGGKADQIDGILGEGSQFDATFGTHADGVSTDTAVVPPGWKERLVPYVNPNTRGVTALCLEPHDLCVSKLVAFREKDREFVGALLSARIVEPEVVIERLQMTDTDPRKKELAIGFVRQSSP